MAVPPSAEERVPIFISHASADLAEARAIEEVLEAAGYDPWLDLSDIHLGVLLRPELGQAIATSRATVLMWSQAAAASRWVAAEILRSFHTGTFIVPCVLDATPLPQFLSRSVHLDLRRDRRAARALLAEKLRRVPNARNELVVVSSYRGPRLKAAIEELYSMQAEVLDKLDPDDPSAALARQRQLDPKMGEAEQRWPYDPTILNLAGYHRKNAYMLNHWAEYCAGRFPDDPVLHEGEKFFFDVLMIDPVDCSALNGLGNILLFEGELDAAEFFVECAIRCAQEQGLKYDDPDHDLRVIRARRRAPQLGRLSEPASQTDSVSDG